MATRVLPCVLLATVAQALVIGAAVAFEATAVHRSPSALISSDVERYYAGTQAFPGRLDLRALVEYPLFALPIFLLPRLLTSDLTSYALIFAAEMLLANGVALLLIGGWMGARRNLPSVPSRVAWYTLSTMLLFPLVVSRFDLVPTTVAFAAALAWFAGRPVIGGAGAGLGTLIKLFPACVAAVGFLYEARDPRTRRLRGTVAFVLTMALGAGVSWAFGASGFMAFQAARGLQIESVPAGVLMAAAQFTGAPLTWVHLHNAYELQTRGAGLAAALTVPMQAAALLIVLWRFWRSDQTHPFRSIAAAMFALLITAKVLSPQFLIWPIPFLAVLEGPPGGRARWLFLPCCLATTLIFPFFYFSDLLTFAPWAIALLNVRNALLIALFAVLTFGAGTSGRRAGAM